MPPEEDLSTLGARAVETTKAELVATILAMQSRELMAMRKQELMARHLVMLPNTTIQRPFGPLE